MFDFSQIQIPANLLAGLLLIVQFLMIDKRGGNSSVSILNQLFALGGSGSSSAPSGAPARARVGEEDPAAIRLRFNSIQSWKFQVSGTILIFREMLRANPDQMAMLKQNNPKLSEALESGDLEAFAKVPIHII